MGDRLSPSPVPLGATPAPRLTPISLYTLGFRGYEVNGAEVILPPICFVATGAFEMGNDKARNPNGSAEGQPRYSTEVAAFSIGQHPVTVAEYACAVSSGVAPVPQEWGELPWAAQVQRPNHPVVCVSWNEATAYARWLAHVTGQPWRLPTEAEWEKAARWDSSGPDGHGVSRLYPWGDTFDKALCNTSEGRACCTTPVGAYPAGASPCGAQGMAGNVWEWTSSLKMPYPYRASDGREADSPTGTEIQYRVFRGGSWAFSRQDAWAETRSGGVASSFGEDVGFRLALASPDA